METERYKALLTALECGSLAAAAGRLGYTTSGMSRMMAALEKETGMRLLLRSKNGVRPTPECEQILPAVRELIHASDSLRQKERSAHGVISGTVRVGTAYSYYYEMLAEDIYEFRKEHPDVSVEIIYGYSTELAEKLNRGELDICMISRRETAGKWIPLKKDEMLAVVASDHPLAEKKSVPVSAFAVQPYIYTHPGSDSDSARVFQKYGVLPNTRYTTQDSLATLSMVKAGLGITLNNKLNTDVWADGGVTALPLRPRQMIEIGAAVRENPDEAVSSFAAKLLTGKTTGKF